MPWGENCVREVPNTPRHLCRKKIGPNFLRAGRQMPPLLVLLIINNTTKASASDEGFHTFKKRNGQDDAQKGSSNRPVGQPKEGSKTPIWQARNHSNKQPQRIFQYLASTIAPRAYAFLSRRCFFCCSRIFKSSYGKVKQDPREGRMTTEEEVGWRQEQGGTGKT